MTSAKETPEERDKRLELERRLQGLARAIKHSLPDDVGFTLLLFNYGDGAALAYISSADRDDVTKVMKEFIARHDKGLV